MADMDDVSEIDVVEWPSVEEPRATWRTSVNPPCGNPNGGDLERILRGIRALDAMRRHFVPG